MLQPNEVKPPKVSVIIPVYNTELHLKETLESICNQSLKEIEIITINDGSTDNSLSILETYSLQDKRIKVFSQANKGQSQARNKGLLHATGEYIYFIDSDDLIEENTLEVCYTLAQEKSLDIVYFDAIKIYSHDGFTNIALNYNHTNILDDNVYSGLTVFKAQLDKHLFTPSVCLNFINHNFLREQKLRFFPGIIHEDQLFTVILYLRASRTAQICQPFYKRRLREESIMTKKFSWQNVEGYLTVANELIKYSKHSEKEIQRVIRTHLEQMLNAAIWQAHVLPLKKRIQLTMTCIIHFFKYIKIKSILILLLKKHLIKT